jgi:hypothetical protein
MWQLLRDVFNRIKRFLKWESAAPSSSTLPVEPAGTQQATPSLPRTQAPLTPTAAHQRELNIHSPDLPKYVMWKSILTREEHLFFKALLQDVGNEYQVFAKVRLGDIFKLANEPADRKYHNNQIQCKHFDFLLCDKGLIRPVLAIELDDGTHKQPDHRDRDNFKDLICTQSGLALLRFGIRSSYQPGYIKEQVYHKLEKIT